MASSTITSINVNYQQMSTPAERMVVQANAHPVKKQAFHKLRYQCGRIAGNVSTMKQPTASIHNSVVAHWVLRTSTAQGLFESPHARKAELVGFVFHVYGLEADREIFRRAPNGASSTVLHQRPAPTPHRPQHLQVREGPQ